MKNGFIKVAALWPAIVLADCETNAKLAADALKDAAALGADIAVFPEMYLSGATCGDLLKNRALTNSASDALEAFLELTLDIKTLCFIGYPALINGKVKSLVAVCRDGELLDIVSNERPRIFDCMDIAGLKVGAVLGGDRDAADLLCHAGANVIVDLCATPESIGSAKSVCLDTCATAKSLACAYIRANAGIGESTTDGVYSGHCVISECGELLAEKKPFSDDKALITEIDIERINSARSDFSIDTELEDEDIIFFLDKKETSLTRRYSPLPFIPDDESELDLALEIQAQALARRFTCTYSKKLVIGISGGLDSTLAILVAVKAAKIAGKTAHDVIGITMPCFGTTNRTRSNAEILCLELGVDFRCINIAKAVTQHLSDIGHSGDPSGVAFENSQARERTQILMDLANMEGGLVVGTGDLSELALGWATYNGDHMSMYSVNADVPKTLVRRIVARYADTCGNDSLARVLRDILDTPVSPELLPAKDGEIAQKTEELLGPYEIHDFLLYHTLKYGASPEKLFRLVKHTYGNEFSDSELISYLTTFARRFITQQFKRSCSPDGPKVCEVGLSPRAGWHAPSDASAAIWLREIEKLK